LVYESRILLILRQISEAVTPLMLSFPPPISNNAERVIVRFLRNYAGTLCRAVVL